jgi:hypothetical protein
LLFDFSNWTFDFARLKSKVKFEKSKVKFQKGEARSAFALRASPFWGKKKDRPTLRQTASQSSYRNSLTHEIVRFAAIGVITLNDGLQTQRSWLVTRQLCRVLANQRQHKSALKKFNLALIWLIRNHL